MRRGKIKISQEYYTGIEWPEIKDELDKVFKIECVSIIPNGIVELNGQSDLFDEANELESPQYTAWFETIDGKPKFNRFEKI